MRDVDNPFKAGDKIPHEWANAIMSQLKELRDNPSVMPPLASMGGAIYLGQDYQVWNAKTTGTITARVGTTWGHGNANFYTVDIDGVESVAGGFEGLVAWNYFGAAIASGIRVQVAWTYDKWVIVGGDCSGVA